MQNPSSPVGEDANARRQRLREQMKAFYGSAAASTASATHHKGNNASMTAGSVKTTGGPGGKEHTTVSTTGGATLYHGNGTALPPSQAPPLPPSMNMDSEFFNVQHYTTHLLQHETLKGLVETDTRLLRSVRHLDRELQELVYRNYAKFISATETIREMRGNVSEMANRLSALHSHVETVDRTSQNVFTELEPHRAAVEETITTNRKLKKAHFLRHLPETITALSKEGKYNDCVQYWVMGDAFFQKHVHQDSPPPLRRLQNECWEVVRGLYQKMEDEISGMSLDDPSAMDDIHHLVEGLRLLRATSLFRVPADPTVAKPGVPPPHPGAMADGTGLSFEESVRRVLMRSVQAKFKADMNSVILSLQEVLQHPACPATVSSPQILPGLEAVIKSLHLVHRHLPLEQLTLLEPLAHLKSACALLAANSKRIHELLLLQSGGGGNQEKEEASAHIAEHIQPALIHILGPIRQYFTSWIYTYFNCLFIHLPTKDSSKRTDAAMSSDSSSCEQENALCFLALLHHPTEVKAMMDHFAAALFRQLRQLSTTLKNLGETYLNTTLRQFQSTGYAVLVDQCVVDILSSFASLLQEKIREEPPPSFGFGQCVATTSEGTKSNRNALGSCSALSLLLCTPSRVPPVPGTTSSAAGTSNAVPTLSNTSLARGGANQGGMALLDRGAERDEGPSSSTVVAAASCSAFHFILSRFALAGLVSAIREHLYTLTRRHATGNVAQSGGGRPNMYAPPSGDAPNATNVAPPQLTFNVDTTVLGHLISQLEVAVTGLVHRAILLEGQLSTERLQVALLRSFTAAPFVGGDEDFLWQQYQKQLPALQENAASPSLLAIHPLFLSVVLVEWTVLYRILRHLPELVVSSLVPPNAQGGRHYRSVSGGGSSMASGVRGGSSVGSSHRVPPPPQPQFPSRTSASGTRPSAAPLHRTKRSNLTVEYQRRELTSLQHNIDAIFLQQTSLLETKPSNGSPHIILRSIVVYVLRGLVDRIRTLDKQVQLPCGDDPFHFQLVQLHCTFLLVMLLDPPHAHSQRGSSGPISGGSILSTREWANSASWGEATCKLIQREMDEACMCAYERAADPVVPASNTGMDKSIREALELYEEEMTHRMSVLDQVGEEEQAEEGNDIPADDNEGLAESESLGSM